MFVMGIIHFLLFLFISNIHSGIWYSNRVTLKLDRAIQNPTFPMDVMFTMNTFPLVLSGLMKEDCSDLKIVNDTSTIQFWVENGCGSNYTNIVIRISSLPFKGFVLFNTPAPSLDEEYVTKKIPIQDFRVSYLNDLSSCPSSTAFDRGPEGIVRSNTYFLYGDVGQTTIPESDGTHDHLINGRTLGRTEETNLKVQSPCADQIRRSAFADSYDCQKCSRRSIDEDHDDGKIKNPLSSLFTLASLLLDWRLKGGTLVCKTKACVWNHDHVYTTFSSQPSSPVPKHKLFSICKSDTKNEMKEYDDLTFLSSVKTDIPSTYDFLSGMNERFVGISFDPGNTNIGTEYDSTMDHTHTSNPITTGQCSDSEDLGYSPTSPNPKECSSNKHVHSTTGTLQANSNLNPPYIDSFFVKSRTGEYSRLFDGIIMMVEPLTRPCGDLTCPPIPPVLPGWMKVNFVEKYIRGVDASGTFSSSSGTETHRHDVVFSMGSHLTKPCQEYNSGGTIALNLHHHQLTSQNGVTSLENHEPRAIAPFFFYKRNMEQLTNGVTYELGLLEFHECSCFGILSNKKSVCSGRGLCTNFDQCSCSSENHGIVCQEYIFQKAIYTMKDPNTYVFGPGEYLEDDSDRIPVILVNYTVDISEIQAVRWKRGMETYFDCSLMFNDVGKMGIDTQKCRSQGKKGCCVWMMSTLKYTKYLIIENVEINKVNSLSLRTITNNKEDVDIDVTPYEYPPKKPEPKQSEVSEKEIVENIVAIVFEIIGSIGILGFLLCCCHCCCCICCLVCCVLLFVLVSKSKMRKYERLKDLNVILKEQEIDIDPSLPKMKINHRLFIVSYDDIKMIEKIGVGGSGGVCYKSKWKGRYVCFKLFKCHQLFRNQRGLDDFETEVEILSSVHHPNILQFFGCSVHIPNLGIVCELCTNFDVKSFLTKNPDGQFFPLVERIRILEETSSAMNYLHLRKIWHRDLKAENVLITGFLSARLADFGLSRVIEHMSTTKTRRIGTLVYMPPEISRGDDYNEKCDVFSFSILMWEVMTIDFDPYGKEVDPGLEFKVAADPDYRPSLKNEKVEMAIRDTKSFFAEGYGLKELLMGAWSNEPSERPTFEEINGCLTQAFGKMKKEHKRLLEEQEKKLEEIDEKEGVHVMAEEEDEIDLSKGKVLMDSRVLDEIDVM